MAIRGIINISEILNVEIQDDKYAPMSLDEYNWFIRLKSIFGRRGHSNQKRKIFHPNGTLNESKAHCYRCGKPFRIPWDNIGDVCRKCDDEMRNSDHTLPWKKHDASPSDGNIMYNLFNSR